MTRMLKAIALNLVVLTWSVYGGGDVRVPTEKVIAENHNISPLYLGIGFTIAKFHACNNINCTYEDQTYGAIIRAGYDINRYVAIEMRALKTFWDKGPFGGVPLQHVGLFAKPQYPVNERLKLYALLGYGYTKNLGNGARLNYFNNDHGFSSGLGFEYNLSSKNDTGNTGADRMQWSLFADYQRLLIKSGAPDMDAVSLGIICSF